MLRLCHRAKKHVSPPHWAATSTVPTNAGVAAILLKLSAIESGNRIPAAYSIRAPRERNENLLPLLFQNEPPAGHLEMRQFGEERHPEQPNLKPIVGEHRGRDVAH
jgi:hypothetical protein